MARTTFYLQIEPNWSHYAIRPDGEPKLSGISAARITQNRPQRPLPGTVITKLTVEIPDAAFYPLAPEAIIVVPESLVALAPIEVTATATEPPLSYETP